MTNQFIKATTQFIKATTFLFLICSNVVLLSSCGGGGGNDPVTVGNQLRRELAKLAPNPGNPNGFTAKNREEIVNIIKIVDDSMADVYGLAGFFKNGLLSDSTPLKRGEIDRLLQRARSLRGKIKSFKKDIANLPPDIRAKLYLSEAWLKTMALEDIFHRVTLLLGEARKDEKFNFWGSLTEAVSPENLKKLMDEKGTTGMRFYWLREAYCAKKGIKSDCAYDHDIRSWDVSQKKEVQFHSTKKEITKVSGGQAQQISFAPLTQKRAYQYNDIQWAKDTALGGVPSQARILRIETRKAKEVTYRVPHVATIEVVTINETSGNKIQIKRVLNGPAPADRKEWKKQGERIITSNFSKEIWDTVPRNSYSKGYKTRMDLRNRNVRGDAGNGGFHHSFHNIVTKENVAVEGSYLCPYPYKTLLRKDKKVTVTPDHKMSAMAQQHMGARTPGRARLTAAQYKAMPEYKRSGLETMNIAHAWGDGWTGNGAPTKSGDKERVLGIIDTALNVNHESISGKVVKILGPEGGAASVQELLEQRDRRYATHGGHVAGLAVGKLDGKGNVGVAPDAKIIFGAACNKQGVCFKRKDTYGMIKAMANDPVYDVAAINMSFGSIFNPSGYADIGADGMLHHRPGSKINGQAANEFLINAIYTHAQKLAASLGTSETVLVQAAGNAHSDSSSVSSHAIVATDKDGKLILGGRGLVVGSWNSMTKKISQFSNGARHYCRKYNKQEKRCMDEVKLSDFYVLADGSNQLSADATTNDGYFRASGTSMAAPKVAGLIKVVVQRWPYMKGAHIVKMILVTADKNFLGYDEAIHGQGVVNVKAVLVDPYGELGLPVTGRFDGKKVSVNGAMTVPAELQGAVQEVFSNVMGVDDLQRSFNLNLSDMVQPSQIRVSRHSDLVGGKRFDIPLKKGLSMSFKIDPHRAGNLAVGVKKRVLEVDEDNYADVTAALISEEGSWLGQRMSGNTFGKLERTMTVTTGADVAKKIGNTVIRGSGDIAASFVTMDDSCGDCSMVQGISPLISTSFEADIGQILAYNKNLATGKSTPRHTVGLRVAQDVKVQAGKMNYSVPAYIDRDGNVHRKDGKLDLSKGKGNTNFKVYYDFSSKDGNTTVHASIGTREKIPTGRAGKGGGTEPEYNLRLQHRW